jgi:hypothetical protein
MEKTITINDIGAARLLTLRQGLSLEIKGMTRHGRSCYSIIKDEFDFRGNKQNVFDQFTRMLKEAGILA